RLGLDRRTEPLAHPALGFVLDAAADLELDLDQRRILRGVRRRREEVSVDLGDALADLDRRQCEAPDRVASVAQLRRLAVAVVDARARGVAELVVAEAVRLDLAAIAGGERYEREQQRLHAATPLSVTS